MSKISDEILKQIKAEIEARGVNPSSMDELNKIAAEVMIKQNNKAISDFQGLSPTQMHLLNNFLFSDKCTVRFKNVTENDLFTGSVILQSAIAILNSIDPVKGLKLTSQGNLPRKVVSLIYDIPLPGKDEYRYRPAYVPNEKDYLPSAMSHALLVVSKAVIVRKNRLFITARGKIVMKDNNLLYRSFFEAFATKYNKGYLDSYGENGVGNVGIGYVIYLLKMYGKVHRPVKFYCDLYFKAFPMLIDQTNPYSFTDTLETACDCFTYRVFTSGFYYFGLIEMESAKGKDYFRTYNAKVSPLFNSVFEINS